MIPDEVAKGLAHLTLLDAKIERLKQARGEALGQLELAVGRHEWDFLAASTLWRQLQAAAVVGRMVLLKAAGWHPSRLVNRRPHLPAKGTPCVYALLERKKVVYVGRSQNLMDRLHVHRHEKRGLWDEVEFFECQTEAEMFDLESVLIDQHQPPLNRKREPRHAHATREGTEPRTP